MRARRAIKTGLSALAGDGSASGVTILIYHRVGGGSADERDVSVEAFKQQMELLALHHDVVTLDRALDALEEGDDAPRVVLTFDDGFADVHHNAFPRLAERGLPFTLYVASRFVGGMMHWNGSTASAPGPGLSWGQLARIAESGLCTIANHTHGHVRPRELGVAEIDRCSDVLEERLGMRPHHFAYPWGFRVPAVEPALRQRFRSAVTGELGRNLPGVDPMCLRRVPVRQSDPLTFFSAKLSGQLWPERAYASMVTVAKHVRPGMRRRPAGR
ncbi:MAG: polysaccharide deacetylase family protein [Actinobacteria bacterium]|nr:polysaccharide deacetylase family protein [Actinomycetota bacterium]